MIIDEILESVLNEIRWQDSSFSYHSHQKEKLEPLIREKLEKDISVTIDEATLIIQHLMSPQIASVHESNQRYHNYIEQFDPTRIEARRIINRHIDDTHKAHVIVEDLIDEGLINT